MNCPYCAKEMELGYIQCRDGVSWVQTKSAIAALASLKRDSLVLASGGGPFSGSTVEAYRCRYCKKLIIDYEHDSN